MGDAADDLQDREEEMMFLEWSHRNGECDPNECPFCIFGEQE
jgi:hypothetical protein